MDLISWDVVRASVRGKKSAWVDDKNGVWIICKKIRQLPHVDESEQIFYFLHLF